MRSSIALIALSLAGFGALGCVRETVSCADNPSAVCPEIDTGPSDIDASTDARVGTDANRDAFSVFDAFMPDAGNDAFIPDAYIVPDATMCNPVCSGTRDICISMNVCGECRTDADCTDSPGGSACDTVAHTCVPCVNNSHCGSATAPACNVATHTRAWPASTTRRALTPPTRLSHGHPHMRALHRQRARSLHGHHPRVRQQRLRRVLGDEHVALHRHDDAFV